MLRVNCFLLLLGTLLVLVLVLMSPNVYQPVLVNLTSLLFQTQCVSLFVCHLDFCFLTSFSGSSHLFLDTLYR